MKILSGSELVGYIEARQAKQVRALRQASRVFPKLAIIQTIDDPVIDMYVRLKQRYASEILIEVELHKIAQADAISTIEALNADDSVHGIIIQLPLADISQTQELVNLVNPDKDVDALGANALMDPATPMAISWLLVGYGIELAGKNIIIVGNGRLVGAPLARMWRSSGLNVTVLDEQTPDIGPTVKEADILVSAVGVANLITSEMIRPDTVVVDAATSSEGGKVVGDIASEVRSRQDIIITPEKGGVGPLTVAALFDNVIRAAQTTAKD